MNSTPSSPTSRRRRSSRFSVSGQATPITSPSRRSSQTSAAWGRSSQAFPGDGANPTDFPSPVTAGANGMDSLADELANAWDGSEVDGVGEEMSEVNSNQANGLQGIPEGAVDAERARNGQLGIDSFDGAAHSQVGSRTIANSPNKKRPERKHSRTISAYEGSDYGDPSEHESFDGFPPLLMSLMADVEDLNTQSKHGSAAGYDELVGRLTKDLIDLTNPKSQQNMENEATRFITAEKSLSSHLTNETRNLQNHAHFLFLPRSVPLDEEMIDELLPLIESAMNLVPQPRLEIAAALSKLSEDSHEAKDSLKTLSDSLHMSVQVEATVARRLRSARELVAQMSREYAECDDGVEWVEEGKWQTRLADRECAKTCKDVVGGFEEVCQGWREKLLASEEVGA